MWQKIGYPETSGFSKSFVGKKIDLFKKSLKVKSYCTTLFQQKINPFTYQSICEFFKSII